MITCISSNLSNEDQCYYCKYTTIDECIISYRINVWQKMNEDRFIKAFSGYVKPYPADNVKITVIIKYLPENLNIIAHKILLLL